MWPESFQIHSRQAGSLGQALLKKDILSLTTPLFERASAVIAARLAVAARRANQRFIIMAPPPCEYLGVVVAAGLLLADFVHKKAPGSVPPGEAGPLLDGDLLIVTHSVGDTIDRLGGLSLGGEKLQDHWYVGSYSKYFLTRGTGARVFVANPGWVLDGLPGRRVCGIVIDATHPRILSNTPMLLEKAGKPHFQIIIAAPLLKGELSAMGYPEKAKLWLWDPEAKKMISEAVSGRPSPPLACSKRSIWICKDSEVDETLSGVHDLLAECNSLAGKPIPALQSAWALYHRLRQLSVPLAQFEDSTSTVWGAMSLGKRLEQLQNEWPDTVSVELRWPGIVQGLQKIYDIFKKREEPSKFFAVAERAEEHMRKGGGPLRIVVPTKNESNILNVSLNILVKNWLRAQEDGRIEVVSAREEARRVSMGEAKPTLLLGPRVGAQRYLDVYPDFPTEVIAYPYEADIDLVRQERLYGFVESLQEDRKRTEILVAMGLTAGSGPAAGISARPSVQIAGSVDALVRKARIILPDPKALDLEQLASSGVPTSWDEDIRLDPDLREGAIRIRDKDVFVTFLDGRVAEYAVWQLVDIYHPGTDDTRRYPASDLKPGMRAVLLVDGMYESLFDRLIDALQARLEIYAKMILGLWDQAKAAVLQKHRYNRSDIWNSLYKKGLQIEYGAMLAWFRNEKLSPQLGLGFSQSISGSHANEAIGPQKYSNMKIVAEYSGLFPDESMIQATFKVIEEERQRRRKAGKSLHELLRAIASGTGYDRALSEARKLDSKVADVLAAVEIQEIRDVRIVGRVPASTE